MKKPKEVSMWKDSDNWIRSENVFKVHPTHRRDAIIIFAVNVLAMATLIATVVWIQNCAV